MKQTLSLFGSVLLLITHALGAAEQAELKNLTVNGGIEDGKARLVIEAQLNGFPKGESQKLLFATALEHSIRVSTEKIAHALKLTVDILQGDPKELLFII